MPNDTIPLPEPAPPHSLPEWSECALRVGNSNFLEKRQREGGYGPEADSKLATQLHRFIYEYDDADPYRSAWFMHRLELMLNEYAAAKDARIKELEDALRGLDEAYCRAGSPLTKAERHEDRMRLIAARAALGDKTPTTPHPLPSPRS